MKNLIFILLFITAYSLNGQTISMADLQEKVFDVGSGTHLTKNGTFRFECDCCSGKILFNADTTFYTIGKCENKERLYTGTFKLKDNELILSTFNTEVTKIYNEQKEFDESQPQYFYKDTIISPSKEVFKASFRDGRLQLSNSVLDLYLLPADDDYSDAFNKITEDNRDKRIQHAVNKNIDPFEGIIGFSSENDSLIINRYLKKLNTEFAEFYEDGEYAGYMGGYHEGHVTYAPDNSFKIFVFDGESCGAHCSSMYYSIIQYASGETEEDAGFGKIVSLSKKKGTSQYYIICSAWGGGTAGGQRMWLICFLPKSNSLCSLINDIKALPLPLKTLFNPNAVQQDFTIENSNSFPGNMDLTYDVKTDRIFYTYTYNPRYVDFEDYIPDHVKPVSEGDTVQVTGSFILQNGEVVDFNERYERVEY